MSDDAKPVKPGLPPPRRGKPDNRILSSAFVAEAIAKATPEEEVEAAGGAPVAAEGAAPEVAAPPTKARGDDTLGRWVKDTGAETAIAEDLVAMPPPRARWRRYAIAGGVAALFLVFVLVLALRPHGKRRPDPRTTPIASSAGSDTAHAPTPVLPEPTPAPAPAPTTVEPEPEPEPEPVAEPPPAPTPAPTPARPAPPPPAPAPTGTARKPPPRPSEPKASEPRPADRSPTPARPTRAEAELAYREGIQLAAVGDTAGAARALRTSAAGNPRHAPTWRALGEVYEKRGDKGRARDAYRHYLQLAPKASDASRIKARLDGL